MREIKDIIADNRELLLHRDDAANKGDYGKLLIIAGSSGMAGAAYLAALAAFRTGIGMVKILGPECNRVILQTKLPEAMYQSIDIKRRALIDSLGWADYVIAGCGLSKSQEAKTLIDMLCDKESRPLLADKKLLLFDADALNIIAMHENEYGGSYDLDFKQRIFSICPNTVITPHIGEMARLTDFAIPYIISKQENTAEGFASYYGITVVLKNAQTAVSDGQETMLISSGCGAMAKAGSGDVLCGFIAGTAAMLKGNLHDAVPLAVWLHGRAGCIASDKYGCHSTLAGDIAEAAGSAIKSCENE